MSEKCPRCGADYRCDFDSEDEQPASVLYKCGTFVYADGNIADGWSCLHHQRDALRAEVAKYHGMEVEDAALRVDKEELRAEIAALKAMYEPPLTEGDVSAIARHNGVSRFDVYTIDAACMKVRRERGKA